jgi:hypothetical protein
MRRRRLHVGRRLEAAVRHDRIGAEDEEEGRAIEVGHGHRESCPEHEPGAHLLRHLVDRAGGEHVAGAEGSQQRARVEHQGEEVRRRIAQVDRHRVAPVLADERGQARIDLRERVVPSDALPARATPDHGVAQPVGIVVQVLQRRAWSDSAGRGSASSPRMSRSPHAW